MSVEIAKTNEAALQKYLVRYPDDLQAALAYLKKSGRITDTPYVMNLIASIRERNVYGKDESLSKFVGPLDAEFVSSKWESPQWYSSQYNADVLLSVFRDRPKLTEGIYTCARCGSSRTRLRTNKASGDEAIPVEIYCVGCGHKWSE